MGGLVGWLAGAPQQASTFGSYYQNAANELATEYGSPAAQMFSKEEMGMLRPQFEQQNQEALGNMAALGLTGSGAGRNLMGDVDVQQSGQIAGAVAPLYQQALGQYGNIIGEMPGAQTSGYQDAISNFYQALQTAAEAYGASGGGGGGGGGSTIPVSSYGTSGLPQYSGGAYAPNQPFDYGGSESTFG